MLPSLKESIIKMLKIILFFIFTTSLFSLEVTHFRWEDGLTYSGFLEKYELPRKELLNEIDDDNHKLIEEIRAGFNCQMILDENKKIEQVLIPINDELQIHIFKTTKSYKFEIIPIISDTKRESIAVKITVNPSVNIYRAVKNENYAKKLNGIFKSAFKKSLDFTALRKGDNLVMVYNQKYRLGQPFSMPTLLVAMIEIHKKPHYIYLNSDDRYYDEKGNQVEGFLLGKPIPNARISSRFTKRRFHPILKKWKAHTGVDFAAVRGTPIHAAGSGKIIYAGWAGGYGNVIKIAHTDGYVTLYAHQTKFRAGMRRGKKVGKGQIIGYVGTTGRSTGPHLHFGLYKHGKPINPLSVVQVTTKKLKAKEKKKFNALKEAYDEEIALHLETSAKFKKQNPANDTCYIYTLPTSKQTI